MWPDKEAKNDYLNFRYMVDLIVDIATNKSLSPSTIGLYGDWGSGKSTLMNILTGVYKLCRVGSRLSCR